MISFCKACESADPEKKVPRRKVPGKCLEPWENEIFNEEGRQRQAKVRAASKAKENAYMRNGISLEGEDVSWEQLKGALEDEENIRLFKVNGAEYALVYSRAIQTKDSNSTEVYPLEEIYENYKDVMHSFCETRFNTDLVNQGIEQGEDLWLILHNNTGKKKLVVKGFMTLRTYGNRIYIGTFCIGPKGGGLGKASIQQIQQMVMDDEKIQYIELVPADGVEDFYTDKLGFKPHPNKQEGLIWCKLGATGKICRSPANEKGSGSKNDS
jgi:hypothetical protein